MSEHGEEKEMWQLMELCPFCGSENLDSSFATNGSKRASPDYRQNAGCMDCGATGPDGVDDRTAVAAWNQRAEAARLRAALARARGEDRDDAR